MENFNPTFVYREGKLNILPDFLSRNPINFIKKKNTVTGKLEELENQIYQLTRDNWITQQRKCPRLSGIIERLEATKSENQTLPHKITDGILRFCDRRAQTFNRGSRLYDYQRTGCRTQFVLSWTSRSTETRASNKAKIYFSETK